MPLDFPPAPAIGDAYSSPDAQRTWTWDGTAWLLQNALLDDEIAEIVEDPDSATNNAIEALAATKVAKAGDTMTGNLTISKDQPEIAFKPTIASSSRISWYDEAAAVRWRLHRDGTTGSLILVRYDSAGVSLGSIITFNDSINQINMSGATTVIVPTATGFNHAVRKDYLDAKHDRIFIPADRIGYDSAAPVGISRGFVAQRPVIAMTNVATGILTFTIDPIAEGIGHWLTWGTEFMVSAVNNDAGTVWFRRSVQVDQHNVDPVGFTMAQPVGVPMGGVTNRIQRVSSPTGQLVPTPATSIWRFAIDRLGTNASDTSAEICNLHGVAIYRFS